MEASDSENVTFTTTAPVVSGSTNNGNIQIALAQTVATRGGNNRKTLDNAIVTFNEGSQLGKFYFGTQNANIYLPQNGEDYAIAYSERQGELPVNFVANQDGEYTLSINPKDVNMNYLHLIDNMTGADVDLLPLCKGGRGDSKPATYTFYAKTTDYASRFRLVFAADSNNGNADGDNAFAFISNGNIIVNGTGTLQVIDVTGRIVRCADVARNVSTNGMTAGVYVLRLINGNDVKTQKIVIN